MKNIAISLMLLLLSAAPAEAASLTLAEIQNADLASMIGAEVGTPMNNTFDYAPATAGGDGMVFSTVFEGAGAAEGQYVYLYQVDHYAQSSEYKSGGISIDFGTVSNLDGVDAFFVGDSSGTVSPAVAYQSPDGQLDFYWYLPAGEMSNVFGVVSPDGPQVVTALVLDGGVVLGQADVYASGGSVGSSSTPPMPEPGSKLLLLSGFLVIGIYGLRVRSCA